ncbi:hypothetical protein Bbelb_307710 [Branchiostoma belcheri]|nr:hypothetical protein Bbelb_307710 [Branchiostoma belcheri]
MFGMGPLVTDDGERTGKLPLSDSERVFVARCVYNFEDNEEFGACCTFTIQNAGNTDSASCPNPLDYLVRTVILWDPLRECLLRCYECGLELSHQTNRRFLSDEASHPGYALRLIHCVDETVILVTAAYFYYLFSIQRCLEETT